MTILCYHSVACGFDNAVSVEVADFERQCAALHRRGDVVPFTAVRDRLEATGCPPRGATVMTFDDGFADFLHHAVPTMQRYGLTAAMYVVAASVVDPSLPVDWVEGTAPADAPPLLNAEEIRELHDRGWEIGSHSMRHRDLPTLSEQECLDDLRESRELLSDLLGVAVTTLAYPFGRHDEHVRRAARRAGYTCALALPEGPEASGPFAVPRVGVYRGNSDRVFRLKAGDWYPRVRMSTAYRATGVLPQALRALRRTP